MNIKVDLTEQLNSEPLPERKIRSEAPQAQQHISPDEDRVELSTEALNLASLREQAAASPDIRNEKVEGIMKQIQQGNYIVDSRLIAERMIKDHTGT